MKNNKKILSRSSESIQLFETFLRNTDDLIIFLSPNLEIIDFSSSISTHFQWKKAKYIKKNFLAVLKNSKAKKFFPKISKKSLKNMIIKCSTSSTSLYSNNITWKVSQLTDKKQNRFGFMLETNNCWAKIEAIKRAAKDERDFLEQIIAHMPGFVYWKDENLNYKGGNDNIANFAGLQSPTSIVGKHDSQLGWPSRIEDKEIIRNGRAIINIKERIFPTKNFPDLKYILTSKVPLINDKKKIIGLLGISTDITELTEAQESLIRAKETAEQANIAKANFLATMSHELRTPLNAILGMAQLLEQKDQTQEQKEGLDIIINSSQHLLTLIKDILDFSRLEAGKLEFSYSKFDLHKLIDSTVLITQHLVDSKKIQMSAKYAKGLPDKIVADPDRVRQVILNLVNNAIKFTEKGEICVIATTDKGKRFIKIRVNDTGIGIPADKQKIIFERFVQIDSDKYVRKFSGAGLGLAICKQLVGAMGGDIGVKSHPGDGSSFWFKLPLNLKVSQDKKTAQAMRIPRKVKAKTGTCRILLVEDNPLNQKVMITMLNRLGCLTDLVENGNDAIEKFKQNKYDFALVDLGLPDISGIEVSKELIKLDTSEDRIPIVALTAHAMQEDYDNCYAVGIDDLLTKPVLFPALKKLLARWGWKLKEK